VASYGFTWLSRPAVIVLFVLAATSFVFTLRGRVKSSEPSKTPLKEAMARAGDES
jgi:hypothetical protein